ncbi:hypothetical protein AB0910_15405 [Streptomyces sp. NPDC047002]|uniref:hypothetical protein n=1 Tax=Streptomyces sp. NPDC047002 TaxID=3155475 RepID=UPI00345526AA
MPRPNAAQLAYGSATVVCSAVAMLLLSGAPAGVGTVVIGVAALALGLLVALSVPAPRRARAAREAAAQGASRPAEGSMATAAPRVGAPRAHADAGYGVARVGGHAARR